MNNVAMPINEMIINTIKSIEKGEVKPSNGLLRKLFIESAIV